MRAEVRAHGGGSPGPGGHRPVDGGDEGREGLAAGGGDAARRSNGGRATERGGGGGGGGGLAGLQGTAPLLQDVASFEGRKVK